jgi:CheY-like chemotaxis protein
MNDVNILKNNGVNLESSLEYLGDMEMYNDTLKEFLELIDGKVSDLNKFKDNHDMENYGILAHSIKSDARYLGFTNLAELSLAHEMAGKEGREDFVIQNFSNYLNEINKVVSISQQYLQSNINNTPSQEGIIEIKDNELPSVLVVDDSEIIRNFIVKMCSDSYNIICASDGQMAINELEKENNIKCVLLDLNMPNINGFATLEYLRNNNLFGKYPVSIITGADDKETITDAFKYPIVDMLQKPFNEKEAKRIIERTISYGK